MTRVIKLSSTLHILICLTLLPGIVFSVPLEPIRAQNVGPVPPAPPRLEAYPVERDVKSLGLHASITAPAASSVSFNVLPLGDDAIHGLVYYNNYLYASTRTSPGRVLKIDPSTLTLTEEIILDPGLNEAEDIEAANGYLWTITGLSSPARLIRIDPTSMATQVTPLNSGDYRLDYGESLDFSFGKLWVGGQNRIAEVDISNPSAPTFVSHDYPHPPDSYILGTALSSDDTYLWALFIQAIQDPLSYDSSTLVRINPANPTSGYIKVELPPLFPDDMVNTGGYLFSSTEEGGQPSDAYRFPIAVTPYFTSTISSSESYGVFYTETDPKSLWGAYVGTPGIIKKFDSDLNLLSTLNLPTGYDNPAEIAFDGNGNMYVATFQSPAGIVKYTIPDPVTLSINKSATNVVLSWTNSDALVDHYEIWRSTTPYFSPGDDGSAKLGDVVSTIGAMNYTDPNVLGNININYFYSVRAVNDFGLIAPMSNQVGKLEREIFKTASTDFNWIALPLNANLEMASDLANHIQNNSNGTITVASVQRWNPIGQNYLTFIPPSTGDFDISVGGVYRISVNIATGTSVIWSLLGSLPLPGSISYKLRQTASTDLNWIMTPLDRSNLTHASGLKADIDENADPTTTVLTVERWNATSQNFTVYIPPSGDFPLSLGYPYRISVTIASGYYSTWP